MIVVIRYVYSGTEELKRGKKKREGSELWKGKKGLGFRCVSVYLYTTNTDTNS